MKTRKMKWTILLSLVLFVAMVNSAVAQTIRHVYPTDNPFGQGPGVGAIEAKVNIAHDDDIIVIHTGEGGTPGIYRGRWEVSEACQCNEPSCPPIWHYAIDPNRQVGPPQRLRLTFKSEDPNDPQIVEKTIIYGYDGWICIDNHGSELINHDIGPCGNFKYNPTNGGNCKIEGLTFYSGFMEDLDPTEDHIPEIGSRFPSYQSLIIINASPKISKCRFVGGTYDYPGGPCGNPPPVFPCELLEFDVGGIYLENSNSVIEDSTISIDRLGYIYNLNGAPVRIIGNSNITIRDCNISDNNIHYYYWNYSSPVKINAIEIWDTSNVTITDCTISRNDGEGVKTYSTGNVTITHCTISGNDRAGVEAMNAVMGDITINGGCTIDGGGVSQGICLNAHLENINIMGSTIRNCDAAWGAGIESLGAIGNITIDGCTLIDNNAVSGGAIYISVPSRCTDCPVFNKAVINNCLIEDNKANEWGGGIYVKNSQASSSDQKVIISTCDINSNEALGGGGIYIEDNKNLTTIITHCKITKNKALNPSGTNDVGYGCGAGILSYDFVAGRPHTKIINCMITKNIADIQYDGDDPTYSGGQGGGIWASWPYSRWWSGGSLEIKDSTIANNQAYKYGGAVLYNGGDGGSIYNCIFWENRGNSSDTESYNNYQQIYNSDADGVNIKSCDIEHSKPYGGYIVDDAFNPSAPNDDYVFGIDSGGNRDIDPEFEDPEHSDYHLSRVSPCIDEGDDSLVPADVTDLDKDGNTDEQIPYDIDIEDEDARIIGTQVDIGADEYKEEIPQDRVHNITQKKWYHYIQPAINEAIDGDEIIAYPSTYYENINFWGKAITVRSTDLGNPAATVIDGSSTPGEPAVKFDGGQGLNMTLKGFTVKNGAKGIYCYCSEPTISNCIIEDYTGSSGIYHTGPPPGITIKNSTIQHNNKGICIENGIATIEENQIYDNTYGVFAENGSTVTIRDNRIYGNGQGIYAASGSNATIERNKIYGNSSSWGDSGGIYANTSSTTIIRNNLIYDNKSGIFAMSGTSTISNNTIVENIYGIYTLSRIRPTIYNCILWSNGDDLRNCNATFSCIENCEDAGGEGNICGDANNPRFVEAANNDYHLKSDSPCINKGDPDNNKYADQTDIDGNTRVIGPRVDIGADEYGRVHNITKDKWYEHIQDAVEEATGGDEIVATQDIYYENINFWGKAIMVRSIDPSDPTATVIDGASNPGEPAVKFDGGQGLNMTLKGFTVKNGAKGIYCYCSEPTISNCIIEDYTGAGIYHTGPPPGVTIKNSTIQHNNKGICIENGIATIEENQIYNNTYGVFAENGSTVTIRDNRIYENGSGIFFPPYSHSSATIEGNRIYGNSSEGIYLEVFSTTIIRNNLIYDNGWGIYATPASTATISNNTIVGNTVGIVTVGTSPTIYNCILWGNSDDLRGDNATYSCIEHCEDAGGEGNICGDANNPRFVDATYHIDILSPCINAGDPDPSRDYDDQTDIDGEPRVMMGRVDMGADETPYAAPEPPLSQSNEPNEPPIYPDAHWWKFDEGSGTTAGDYVGDSDGTFNGGDPSWVDGLIGGAVDFDGVDDYFSVASLDSAYNNGSVFTVAGWFKTDQLAGKQTIVGQWSQDDEAGYEYYGWQVLVENKKVIARFGNEIDTYDITGTSEVTDGEWRHFAMVRNGTSSVVLYVNGQPEGTGAANFGTANTKFRIGDGSARIGNPPLKGGPFNGLIDDVMIFNRALTAEEVEQLYQEGL